MFAKFSEKPEIVFAEGNLGEEPPTGSEKETSLEKFNLKAGTGDPCAGQDRLKGTLEDLLTPDVVRSVENLGEDPPTGSAKGDLDRWTNL